MLAQGDILGEVALFAFLSVADEAKKKRSGSILQVGGLSDVSNVDNSRADAVSGPSRKSKRTTTDVAAGQASLLEIPYDLVHSDSFPSAFLREAERSFSRKLIQSMDAFSE